MLTQVKRDFLYKKFDVDSKIIKYKTYLTVNQDNDNVRGVDLEILPLRINLRCHMSKSITFNFKRYLKMVKCILAECEIN